jgi:hypothetical protein
MSVWATCTHVTDWKPYEIDFSYGISCDYSVATNSCNFDSFELTSGSCDVEEFPVKMYQNFAGFGAYVHPINPIVFGKY